MPRRVRRPARSRHGEPRAGRPPRRAPQPLGRYEIVGEIARGAMGVVYKARDPLIDRLVAIKTVHIGMSNVESETFERASSARPSPPGRLNHPNVVTIHDVGKSEDVAFIAMEFLDGKSLREILDSGVVLTPQRIAGHRREIAEGLAFAHRNRRRPPRRQARQRDGARRAAPSRSPTSASRSCRRARAR